MFASDTSVISTTVQRAAAGDESAWQDLVDRFSGLLRSIASSYRLTGDEAADAAQNTWLAFYLNINQLNDPARARAWLATTMRRESLRMLRGRTYECVDDWEQWTVADDSVRVDRSMLVEERDTTLWGFVDQLPSRQRDVICVLESTPRPSYEDAAKALGVPVGTLGPTRGRAIRQLQAMFADAGLTNETLEVA